MEGKEELSPDYSPVNSQKLRVYQIPPENRDERATTTIHDAEVSTQSAIGPNYEYCEYEVDVEYVSSGVAISTRSFENYLETYREARITQESMTHTIHEDLVTALGTTQVFVELERMGHNRNYIGAAKEQVYATKETWVGEI